MYDFLVFKLVDFVLIKFTCDLNDLNDNSTSIGFFPGAGGLLQSVATVELNVSTVVCIRSPQ